MSPDLMPGDLLLARRLPAAEIQQGDVLTLNSPRTGNFVTHRVVDVSPSGDHLEVTMQGDANPIPDAEVYEVPTTSQVWHPVASIPAIGAISLRMTQSPLAIPALISLLALVGFAAIPPKRGRHERVRRIGERFRGTARSVTA
jgi:signal peptidase